MAKGPLPLLDREPAEGVRLVALDLLEEARAASSRLKDPGDAEALHDFRVAVRRLRSWLRSFEPQVEDTLRKKWRRALRDLASATGAARDAEVMRALVLAQREALSPRHRRAADWFLSREAPGDEAGADPRARAATDFERLAPHLEEAFSRYERAVGAGPRGRFGGLAAEVVRAQEGALLTALSEVASADDAEKAHRARIEGKRLRYLLEPLRGQVPGAEEAIRSMKDLQDLLGDLHDVHVLAARMADAAAEAAAEGARAVHHALHAAGEDHARSVARRGMRPGLSALDRRIRERRDALWAELSRGWLAEAGRITSLRGEVDRVVEELLRGPPPGEARPRRHTP
ncbi:MAG TPA: CHAD domain-containing protein [Anaeromyxobacter sp.]|nr:CHAD domain-containing protein [Anaeromyxobacter sp.]